MGWPDRIVRLGLLGLLCLPVTAAVPDCVILLHGLARDADSMRHLAGALEAAGYHVEAPDYPSTEQSLRQLAAPVIDAAIARCPPDGAVHFVGHSMGAMLVRVYLERALPSRLGRVVMLAPPNQGSELSDFSRRIPGFDWYLGPALAELGTGPDSLVRKLGPVNFGPGVIAGGLSSNRLLSLAIPGTDDGRVSLDSTRVDGMGDYLVLPVDHFSILDHPAVIEAVLRFLATGSFAEAG